MKILNLIFTAITFLIVPLISCKKNSLSSDSNYFNCRVDGKKWSHYSGDFKNSSTDGVMFNNGKTVDISGSDSNLHETISVGFLSIDAQIKVGTYRLSKSRGEGGVGSYSKPIEGESYKTTESYDGELTITSIDKEKQIILGTFHFKALEINSNKIVNITNGKFQVSYINQ